MKKCSKCGEIIYLDFIDICPVCGGKLEGTSKPKKIKFSEEIKQGIKEELFVKEESKDGTKYRGIITDSAKKGIPIGAKVAGPAAVGAVVGGLPGFVVGTGIGAALNVKDAYKQIGNRDDLLIIPYNITRLMEVRTESVSRPGVEDIETIYALSGSKNNVVDYFHCLSSNDIIKDASPNSIITCRDELIEQVKRGRKVTPKLLVDIHTHPKGAAELSNEDSETIKEISEHFEQILPNTKIIFGVHAISSEEKRKRKNISKTSKHIINWSSETRHHKVGFYNNHSNPYEVEIFELDSPIRYEQPVKCPECSEYVHISNMAHWDDGVWSCLDCAQKRTRAMGLGPDRTIRERGGETTIFPPDED